METNEKPVPPIGAAGVDLDPRPLFDAALATAAEVIGRLRPDQLDDPTPCDDFDVRGLVAHLVGVVDRVTVIGRGGDPMSVRPVTEGVPDDAWSIAFAAAVTEARAAWADGATLVRTVVLPWATDTGAAALLGYVNEVTVHTWDIATATGQHPEWDTAAVENALDLMHRWLPGENRAAMFAEVRKHMPPGTAAAGDAFAEVVPVPDDAPPIDRLVAWNGRRP